MAIKRGTASADAITGTSGPGEIYGIGGNDSVWGRGGSDLLKGPTTMTCCAARVGLTGFWAMPVTMRSTAVPGMTRLMVARASTRCRAGTDETCCSGPPRA